MRAWDAAHRSTRLGSEGTVQRAWRKAVSGANRVEPVVQSNLCCLVVVFGILLSACFKYIHARWGEEAKFYLVLSCFDQVQPLLRAIVWRSLLGAIRSMQERCAAYSPNGLSM